MCAIFGIIGDYNKKLLINMSKTQKYRGPDKTTYFLNKKNNFSIGMNRLAVIDKKKGNQPMISWNKKIICIFNGTIYNFREVKDFLKKKNVNFITNSDTEVLVNAFSFWGNKCFNYFDGMWAAGFYDFHKKKFTLSRDYLGQKPLFYSQLKRNKLIFSSQINGIFEYEKKFSINNKNLKLYHQFGFTPAPNTIYKNIYQVAPGEILDFKTKIKKSIYWDLRNGPDYNIFFKEKSNRDFKQNFLSTLKNYLIADKSPALSLSSGLDSNILRYSLKKLKVKLDYFTIGFISKSFNEIKDIYKEKNSKHYKKIMINRHILDSFNDIKKKISFANGDGSIIPTYFLFKQIKKRTNVTIGGDGGDEVFFGYITFRAFWLADKIRKFIPINLIKFFKKNFLNLKTSNRYLDLNKKISLFFKYLDEDMSLINSYWINNLGSDEINELCKDKKDHDEIKKIKKLYKLLKNNMRFCQIYYFKYYLPMVLDKIDSASMYNSVESRAPFLSKELVNLSLDTPIKNNFDLIKNKKLLINLLGDQVPKKIMKIKKHGFAFPKNLILKNKNLILKSINLNLLTNKKFFFEKYNQYLKNNNYENYVWNELMLNLSRQNLEDKS